MPPTRAVAKKKKAAARKKAKKVADAALALAVEVVPMKEPKKKKKAAAKKKKPSSSSKPRAPRVRKPSAILREETPHESATEHDEYMRRYAGVIDRRSGRFKGVTRGDWERFFERDPVTKRIGRRDKTREWPVHKQLAARADKAPRVISTVPLRPPPAGGGGGKKKGGKKKAAAPKKKKAVKMPMGPSVELELDPRSSEYEAAFRDHNVYSGKYPVAAGHSIHGVKLSAWRKWFTLASVKGQPGVHLVVRRNAMYAHPDIDWLVAGLGPKDVHSPAKKKKKAAAPKKKKAVKMPMGPSVELELDPRSSEYEAAFRDHNVYSGKYPVAAGHSIHGVKLSAWRKWFTLASVKGQPGVHLVVRRNAMYAHPDIDWLVAGLGPKDVHSPAKKKKKAAAPKKKPFFEKPAKKPRAGNKKKAAAPALLKEVPRAALPDGMEWIESRLNEARIPPPDSYPPPPALPVEALVQPASEADEHYAGARRIGRGSVKRGSNMEPTMAPMAEAEAAGDDPMTFSMTPAQVDAAVNRLKRIAIEEGVTILRANAIRGSLVSAWGKKVDVAIRMLARLRPGENEDVLHDAIMEMANRTALPSLDNRDFERIYHELLPGMPNKNSVLLAISDAASNNEDLRQALRDLFHDAADLKRIQQVINALEEQLPRKSAVPVRNENGVIVARETPVTYEQEAEMALAQELHTLGMDAEKG